MPYITDEERNKFEEKYDKLRKEFCNLINVHNKKMPTTKGLSKLCKQMVELFVQIHGEELTGNKPKLAPPKYGEVQVKAARDKRHGTVAVYERNKQQTAFGDLYNLMKWDEIIAKGLEWFTDTDEMGKILDQTYPGCEATWIFVGCETMQDLIDKLQVLKQNNDYSKVAPGIAEAIDLNDGRCMIGDLFVLNAKKFCKRFPKKYAEALTLKAKAVKKTSGKYEK